MITFFASGVPQPKGSAKAIPYMGKDGRPHASVSNDAGDKAKTWASLVTDAARSAYQGAPLSGAVVVLVTFYMPRPKGHFNKKGLLRPSAPALPTTKPDLDKLTRCAMDALKGVILADDSIITDRGEKKRYATGSAGAEFVIAPAKVEQRQQHVQPQQPALAGVG